MEAKLNLSLNKLIWILTNLIIKRLTFNLNTNNLLKCFKQILNLRIDWEGLEKLDISLTNTNKIEEALLKTIEESRIDKSIKISSQILSSDLQLGSMTTRLRSHI